MFLHKKNNSSGRYMKNKYAKFDNRKKSGIYKLTFGSSVRLFEFSMLGKPKI